MTLWHKPTEKPKVKWKDVIIENDGGNYFMFFAQGYPYGIHVKKWCYLSDLLELEREYKRLLFKVMEQQEEITNLKLDYVHQGRILGTLQSDYKRETGKDWEFFEEY